MFHFPFDDLLQVCQRNSLQHDDAIDHNTTSCTHLRGSHEPQTLPSTKASVLSHAAIRFTNTFFSHAIFPARENLESPPQILVLPTSLLRYTPHMARLWSFLFLYAYAVPALQPVFSVFLFPLCPLGAQEHFHDRLNWRSESSQRRTPAWKMSVRRALSNHPSFCHAGTPERNVFTIAD